MWLTRPKLEKCLKKSRDTRHVEVPPFSNVNKSHTTMRCLLKAPLGLTSSLKWHHPRNTVAAHKVEHSHRAITAGLVRRPRSSSGQEDRFSIWRCYYHPVGIITFPLPTIY
jgi:hypothetical protein